MRVKFIFFSIIILVATGFLFGCKKESQGSLAGINVNQLPFQLDVSKIEETIGRRIQILKMDENGSWPSHLFLWVALDDFIPKSQLQLLSSTIVTEIIRQVPDRFGSFTLHYFRKQDVEDGVLQGRRFAYANYLPHGKWEKAGRVPIDGYKEYKWIINTLSVGRSK